jgi:Flp pilus assembly protein TadD
MTAIIPAMKNTRCLRLAPVALAVAFVGGCVGEADRLTAQGHLALRRGSAGAALPHLRAAARLASQDALAHVRLGQALFVAQHFGEAESAYRKALALPPGKDDAGRDTPGLARRGLGQLLARTGRPAEAEAVLFAAVSDDARDADAAIALARLRLSRQDFLTASRYLDKARAEKPGHTAATYNLGRLELDRGELGRAEAHFRSLAGRSPHKPYGAYGLAVVAARRGESAEACAELARAFAAGLTDLRMVRRDAALAETPALDCPAIKFRTHARRR